MNRKTRIINEIAKNNEIISSINKTELKEEKNFNNMNKAFKQAKIGLLTFLISSPILLISAIVSFSFPSVPLYVIMGLACAANISAIALLCDAEYKNNKNIQNTAFTYNEQFKLLEKNNELQEELNQIIRSENQTTQNLQQPKVLHSKEFKQFKNYLSYKNSKEQSTKQETEQIELTK